MKNDIFKTIFNLNDSGIDLIAYCGPITMGGYHEICDILEKKSKKKIILFLCTFGGNPDAGYRIARAITHHYKTENFSIAIPTDCKSAGTLMCIGASELIVFDKGELGPLDTQIIKQDEMFRQSSGLDLLRGMSYLNDEALKLFQNYLHNISRLGGISTKSASDIAVNMVKGLYTPIYAQIDPLRLGEMQAALQIAHAYGSRLNEKAKSLKSDGLTKLIHHYPTHGFSIDRAEARELFKNVSSPSDEIKSIGTMVVEIFWQNGFIHEPITLDITQWLKTIQSGSEIEDESGVNSDVSTIEDSGDKNSQDS